MCMFFHSCTWGVVRCMNWLHPWHMNIIASPNVWVLKKCQVLVTQLCLTLCNPMDCSPPGSSVHGDFQGKNTGVDCHALLQGIFRTQESNPGLPHCRQILYHLSHLGSPWICVHPILFLFLMLRPYANILVNCFHDTDVKSAGIWSLYEQCCVMSI